MSELFPHESFREGQLESINEILEKFRERNKIVIFKAPTGFGKTSVAIASMLTDPPVIHSVRTRNEIQPVIRDLKKLFDKRRGFAYSFIFSAHRMCPLLRSENIDPEDFWLSCSLLRSLGKCEFYRNSEKISPEEVFYIVSQEILPERAVRRLVHELNTCPFFSLAKLAEASSYVVATYPYALDPELFGVIFESRDQSEYSLVIDEAHMLSIPSRVFSEEFSSRDIEKAVEEIEIYVPEAIEAIQLLQRLKEISEKKAVSNQLRIIRREEVSLDPYSIDLVAQTAAEVKKRVFIELLESRGVESAVSKRVRVVKISSALYLLKDPRFEIFATRDNSDKVLVQVSAVDHSVIKDSLSGYKKILMMSGTPPTREFVARLIDINEVDSVDALSYLSWKPQDNMAVIIATELSSRYIYRGELMYRLYASYINKFKDVEGLKLIVYPSYDFMRNVLSYLSIENDLVETSRTTLEEILQSISRDHDKTIHVVAGGKISEGIEFVRESRSLVKGVFIAGVPYPQPDDYMNELINRGSRKINREVFRDLVITNEAYIRTMQAIGRSVRSELDKALIILGDRRFMSSKLRNALGLERFGVARDLEQFSLLIKRVSEEFL